MVEVPLVKLPWGVCNWTSLMVNQINICTGDGLVPSGSADPDWYHHMASLGHNEFYIWHIEAWQSFFRMQHFQIQIIGRNWQYVDNKTSLVRVMGWRWLATSHYLKQWWPTSSKPHCFTRPQQVNMPELNTSSAQFWSSTSWNRAWGPGARLNIKM